MLTEWNHLQEIREKLQQRPADQDRVFWEAASESLQPAGHVDTGTDHGELEPLAAAQVAGDHLTEVQADPLAQGRPAGFDQLNIQPLEALAHRQGGPHGRQSLLGVATAAGHAEGCP